MQLHLVGGFLGSGKTTAIITAAKYLISQGKRVGVVTNDQGKFLVDTSFFQSNNIPTVEVTNGCFCCNYENFEEKLNQLKANEKPDVIFAESVGSCGDIVATVIRPLLELVESKTPVTSFSVFVDSMLLLAFLQGEELPFSENVLYIFEKQIEEGKILVINKIDLLTGPEVEQITTLAARAFPDKTIHLQNSRSEEAITHWYRLISENSNLSEIEPVDIDYERYGGGEAELAWLDQEISIEVTQGNVFQVVIELIQKIHHEINRQQAAIGHLKFMIYSGDENVKISIPTIEQPGWQHELDCHQGTAAKVLINARVQMEPDPLRDLVSNTISAMSVDPEIKIKTCNVESFKPGFPHPTHRMID